MKMLFLLICMFWDTHLIAENPTLSYSKANGNPSEIRVIKLQEIKFCDSTIASVLNLAIPEIKAICSLHPENHYVRMVFIGNNPTQIALYPEHLRCQFTIDFWGRIKKDIIGYLLVDNTLVIVQGKEAKHFVKKGKHRKMLSIINYPPSNADDWSFWRYTISDGLVTKERHLTKRPQILL